ncbi:Egh16-like virulence factor [Microdochium nivale]|nr:Egh16-like virulence factor [Microdochium nivale]
MFSNPASVAIAAFGLFSVVSSHGLVVSITGANGVTMPGLSVADGTPRDCSSNGCGSQADTAIIRDREIQSGQCGPLGRTQGNGAIDPSVMIASFMSGASAPTNNGAQGAPGVEDNIPNNVGGANRGGRNGNNKRQFGNLLGGLLGGGGRGGNAAGKKTTKAAETSVSATAGQGSVDGLPTASDDGRVTVTFRQINQDGAGPLEAMVDGTSGGTEMSAFKTARVTQDVPGFVAGLSLATNTDFPVEIQMPAGMTCDASVGGANNVCIVRLRNNTPAGPFGGSAAFTQSPAARKRAIAYRIKKRAEEKRDPIARRYNA